MSMFSHLPGGPMSAVRSPESVGAEIDHLRVIEEICDEHLRVATALRSLAPDVDRVVSVIARSLAEGGTLLVCGNGGSAADAQHIVAELTGRFFRDRRPLRALALHANSSSLTAIGNDYGYDLVFAREVQAHGRRGDVLLAISTSGNSPNIVRAIRVARDQGMSIIGMTGEGGGRMRAECDICLRVPSSSTPRIQECHILVGHAICELLEQILC
jgi:D-sedoheptulose 7-phosphate isomerase